MANFSQRSLNQLMSCCQELQDICFEAIKKIDFVVIEGHRGQEAQEQAFATGKSQVHWPKGKHNKEPSDAIDIAPYFTEVTGHIDWKDMAAFGRLMGYIQRIAEEKGIRLRFGLDWDGDFRTMDENFVDAPHIEVIR
jgi:peptidoglycan L-alanyl-D-glutamate endopeptidase CwlK